MNKYHFLCTIFEMDCPILCFTCSRPQENESCALTLALPFPEIFVTSRRPKNKRKRKKKNKEKNKEKII